MPNTNSAKKALRKDHRNRAYNLIYKRNMKDLYKQIMDLIKGAKKKDAQALLPKYYKAVDKAEKEGVIKKNTAARKKAAVTKLSN